MTAIQLTEEHKSKLLEMGKVLFPEYKLIKFTTDHQQFEEGEDNNILLFFSGKKEIAPSIHWFEFCMTYLQDKIKSLNGFNDDYDCDANLMSCWFESQPVDYLYSEFLKLSK